jgi:16S rRNA (cytosine1402-N4)-methyltransferase
MEFIHKPVLLNETISALNIKQNGIYVDGTIGGGGHSAEILKKAKNIRLIAIDRDKEALNAAKKRLIKYSKNITFVHDNFKNMPNILEELNIKADGILLDLGVSSYQIDNFERGFSFKHEAELDMRMNQSQNFSAKNLVNEWSEKDIAKIIFEYGEEKFATKIAKEIVKNRPINTTTRLAEIIDKSIPMYRGRDIVASLQRVFQAIRIEVNDELEGLFNLITKLPSVLNSNGRIAIISFHSLEDRIVKQAFRELSTDCICPPNLPICTCNHRSKGKTITNKPITATEEEIKENSRSSSAKLRVFETK